MERAAFLDRIDKAFRVHPVICILGPRQSGKSTLARQWSDREKSKGPIYYFDLEDDTDLERFREPQLTLDPLDGTVIIDEVQKVPDLFRRLRVLVDRKDRRTRYLILGSASRDLIRQTSETLAGRADYIELTPFSLGETGSQVLRTLWLRGGFPLSFLASNDEDSFSWRKTYIKNYLEREVPALGIRIPSEALRRFWLMLSHYHGQIFNASEIGKSMRIDENTVRRYLDILVGTFMVRRLSPWYQNIGKRQVKAPKLFFRDSGIYHALLGVKTHDELLHHPKMGAGWEGFAIEEVIRHHRADPEDVYFWGTHNKAELDLLILQNGKRIGYEVKYSAAPKVTQSMRIASKDLRLDALRFVFPGQGRFPIAGDAEAIGLESLVQSKNSS